MKQVYLPVLCFLVVALTSYSQNYTSYLTGNSTDLNVAPHGGICLMGRASEDDNGMKWFLEQANGGDILVLRASGGDGYNDYLYSQLNVNVNSVETIVFNNSTAANETYIQQKIQQAEAIWFAGGDQWNYISYWRNTPIDSLINSAISDRNIVIGGTSAGMAIQGGFYFSAENGTVTSLSSLNDPYNNNVTVDSSQFITNAYLQDVVTDTHYDNPDRKGRHVTFLARILVDFGIKAKGIACDEHTAICIDTNGIAKVFGDYPNYDDNAYFIQANCELPNPTPENCSPGNPLDWNHGNEALKVYKVKGTINGSNSFNLDNWETGIGGTWENWHIENGVLHENTGLQPNCSSLSTLSFDKNSHLKIHPNPCSEATSIEVDKLNGNLQSIKILNEQGQTLKELKNFDTSKIVLETNDLKSGMYFIEASFKNNQQITDKLMVK